MNVLESVHSYEDLNVPSDSVSETRGSHGIADLRLGVDAALGQVEERVTVDGHERGRMKLNRMGC